MSGGEIMVLAITAIGCGTGVTITFIKHAFGGRSKALQQEVRAQQDRIRTLEERLMESHRQNDQLQRQLEWHTKMLETQDRLMKQLTDGSGGSRETVGTTR